MYVLEKFLLCEYFLLFSTLNCSKLKTFALEKKKGTLCIFGEEEKDIH